MPRGRYRVCFDGKWQERFDDLDEALDWAREVAGTGRLVQVVEQRVVRPMKLLKVFPEDRTAEGERLWQARIGRGGGDPMR